MSDEAKAIGYAIGMLYTIIIGVIVPFIIAIFIVNNYIHVTGIVYWAFVLLIMAILSGIIRKL